MIIDSHAHIVMPDELYRHFVEVVSARANPIPRQNYKGPSDELLRVPTEQLIKLMDRNGTDVQFISPRPYMMAHSIKPSKVSEIWNRSVNDVIHRQVQMFPDRLRGVAGLPQYRDASPENCLEELERVVKELGFVGCLLNPDPTEGDAAPPPGLGDRFWYPLYEKLVELDVPALIHSASSCCPRESYTLKFINEESVAIISLLESSAFTDFPNLKIVVAHGGGAIPYQMGRFRAWTLRRREGVTFDEKLRRLYFDTCNYSKESLELLFRTVGVDNCLFGTESPGTGSVHNPETGKDFDDLKPVIESIEWLSAEDRKKIFEGNARRVYSRAFPA
ncbi:MAG TPA: amidohydrolase family protein [Rhizomicrobium sp.]|jgi:4-oxalmesaconate hydratase|nr:amidohydrolase family protein [Rhizomicrobium sp.]